MTTIRLTFPAGRYHATPWGRHVNEGAAEWPPSPYRLLRALYDVWQRKCPALPAASVREVLEALALAPPDYELPAAVATHTRSYLSANGKNPTDKNLVFDSFLAFNRPHNCYIAFPGVELGPAQRETLGALLANLNFLGRSESWVDAGLCEAPSGSGLLCRVATAGDRDAEIVPVACAVPPSEYDGKLSWLDGLTYSTAALLKQRASTPPLLRYVRYARPYAAVLTDPVARPVSRRPHVEAVLLGLDSTVLPLVTSTIEVAEQIRTRLMGAHKRVMNGDESLVSPLFSGKASGGGKRLDHGHIYILPLVSNDPERDTRIDRVLIVSRVQPFSSDELNAVRGVRRLWQSDGRPDVRCVVTWQGVLDSLPRLTRAATVQSATPFVPPRHWRKGRDHAGFIADEVCRECRNHSVGAEPHRVEILTEPICRFSPVEFRRNRKNDPVRPGYSLRLTFADPVAVPFSIGYGAHFGLGQFLAAAP